MSSDWVLVKYESCCDWGGEEWVVPKGGFKGFRVQTRKEFDEWKKRVEEHFDEYQDVDGDLYRTVKVLKALGGDNTNVGTINRRRYLEQEIAVQSIFADEAETLIELVGKEGGVFIDPLICDQPPEKKE